MSGLIIRAFIKSVIDAAIEFAKIATEVINLFLLHRAVPAI